MTRAIVAFFVVCLVWAAPSTAWPEAAGDVERARVLFEEGIAASEAEDYPAAISALAASYELSPRPVTLLNLGIFQDRDERWPEAYRSFTQLLSIYGSEISDETRLQVTERLEELEELVARAEVATDPEGAALFVDDEEQGRAPLAEVRSNDDLPAFISLEKGTVYTQDVVYEIHGLLAVGGTCERSPRGTGRVARQRRP